MTTQKEKKENQQAVVEKKEKDPFREYLIRSELLKRKIKQKQIVEETKMCKGMVSMCITQDRRSPKFEKWVRENLGLVV